MSERKYLPTFAELIDRLCIVTLKSIKIPKNKKEYEKEAQDIMHDIDLIIKEKGVKLTGQMIRAIQVNSISNETIWTNESKAREGGDSQDKLLKFTHAVNGVRSLAKNVISQEMGERVDLKIDCLAAEFCKTIGYDWRIWENEKEEENPIEENSVEDKNEDNSNENNLDFPKKEPYERDNTLNY